MAFLDLARERYSVKSYSSQPLEEEKLTKILDAGHLAPTAKNYQSQKIYIIRRGTPAMAKLEGITKCTYGAPVVLLIGYDKTLEWQNPLEAGIHSGVEDASIVATHMMLEAADLGVGSCWINFFPNTETRDAFSLPESFAPVLLLDLGYPSATAKPLPNHTTYRPKEEIVHEL